MLTWDALQKNLKTREKLGSLRIGAFTIFCLISLKVCTAAEYHLNTLAFKHYVIEAMMVLKA